MFVRSCCTLAALALLSACAETVTAPTAPTPIAAKIVPPWESLDHCGSWLYGDCSRPVTEAPFSSGGGTLLDQFNAASLTACKQWDPKCVLRPLMTYEQTGVQSEITRLLNHSDSQCRQMGVMGFSMLSSGSIVAYDQPNAPINQYGEPGESYADTHTDGNGDRVIHLGAVQRRANGTFQSILISELRQLTGHELVHATFGYRDHTVAFNTMRARCG